MSVDQIWWGIQGYHQIEKSAFSGATIFGAIIFGATIFGATIFGATWCFVFGMIKRAATVYNPRAPRGH